MTDDLETAIKAATKQGFRCGFISVASTSSNKVGYLPGVTMQLIQGNGAGRKQSKGRDKLGWYSWTTLCVKNEKKLCVITVY